MKHPVTIVAAVIGLMHFSGRTFAQSTGIVSGTVRDRATQEALPGVTVVLEGTAAGIATDAEGRYRLSVAVGSYNLRATSVGYDALLRANVSITSGNANILNLELNAGAKALDEVTVVANRAIRVATAETPLSVQQLNVEEIKSNPGGNFDISRVIQSLPGVGGTAATGGFRNDIIIRGGAPNENVYYLDGIEVPVINHFQTQGSAGGPVGILNVSFIEDVTLSSSAFNARYDNALSSVLQFRQRDGNPERLQGNLRTSATEVAGTLEGPLAKNTTFLASVRRSYLQLLFKVLDLPIRPNYWDAQYKITTRLSPKTTVTALGIGALDEFAVVPPKNSTPEKDNVLRRTPSFDQWSYTAGFSLRHLVNKGYLNVALSRTQLYNKVDLFEGGTDGPNAGNEAKRILLTRSGEAETKLRLDVNKISGPWRYSYGAVGQYIEYNNRFSQLKTGAVLDGAGNVVVPALTVAFQSAIDFTRFGAFGQVSRALLPADRLTLSFGLRADGNSFQTDGANLLRTLSPRLAASLALTPSLNANASVGRYYKILPSTVLGYRDAAGTLVNTDSRYIGNTHYVAGLEWLPRPATRFTLEGFYKQYDHYPVSVRDGISLANRGGDFAAFGNEAVTSTGDGRTYGVEFFFQQKLRRNLFAVASYTWFRSEFTDRAGTYTPSAWDSRNLVSALLGYKLGRGWEVGLKYRFSGGTPFTPFNAAASRATFATTGVGVLDFGRFNTQRLGYFQQLDFRLDKKVNLRRTTFDFYVDVTNALLSKNPVPPQYSFRRQPDNSFDTTDGQPLRSDGSNGQPLLLDTASALVTPTIGFVLEF